VYLLNNILTLPKHVSAKDAKQEIRLESLKEELSKGRKKKNIGESRQKESGKKE